MKRATKMMIIGLWVVMLLVTSVGCGQKPIEEVETEKIVPVVVAEAREEDLIVYQSFPGTVVAVDEVSLTPKMGGVVYRILVKEGDLVKAGDPIILLEQKDAAQQLAQAQAGYEAAQAQLKNLKEGQLPQQIAQLESGLKQAEASLKNAKDNYERMQELLEEGAISLQQFESVELQYNIALEQYESTKTQLDLLKEATAPGSIQAVEAQVEQARAMVALAQSSFDSTVIKSPIDGTVGAISVKEGQLASPGVPVATVGKLNSVEIHIDVTEDRINSIELGQSAEITVNAASEEVLTGTIHSVSPFKDPRTMLYSVKILVPNDDGLLKSGMFARAKLATAVYSQVVMVPEDAVVFRGEQNLVFLLEGDRVKAVPVEVQATSMGKTSVKGIEPGATIVVEGQEMLQDGVMVSVEDRRSSK